MVTIMSLAAQYTTVYTTLVSKAKELGYALPIHGSVSRDLDVVAIPWTKDACDLDELIIELTNACGGFASCWITSKPHHRWAWIIYLGEGAYVDMSLFAIQSTKFDLNTSEGQIALRKRIEQAGLFKVLEKPSFRKPK